MKMATADLLLIRTREAVPTGTSAILNRQAPSSGLRRNRLVDPFGTGGRFSWALRRHATSRTDPPLGAPRHVGVVLRRLPTIEHGVIPNKADVPDAMGIRDEYGP